MALQGPTTPIKIVVSSDAGDHIKIHDFLLLLAVTAIYTTWRQRRIFDRLLEIISCSGHERDERFTKSYSIKFIAYWGASIDKRGVSYQLPQLQLCSVCFLSKLYNLTYKLYKHIVIYL